MNTRRAELHRVTGETEVAATFTFDGAGVAEMSTGRAGMTRAARPAAVCFAHSYAAPSADASVVAASTDHSGRVVADVARDSVWAMRFHLEKSSVVGLSLLADVVDRADKEVRAS